MRGSPILRAVLVFVALFALAPALWRLTRADARTLPPPAAVVAVKNVKTEVRLTFSAPAKRATIQHLGRELWSKATPSAEENFACEIPWPKEGVELHVAVEWTEGTRVAAMRVRLTAPDGTEHDQSVWGDGTADDVLVFK